MINPKTIKTVVIVVSSRTWVLMQSFFIGLYFYEDHLQGVVALRSSKKNAAKRVFLELAKPQRVVRCLCLQINQIFEATESKSFGCSVFPFL